MWPGRLCVMGDERQTSRQRRFNAQIQHPELTRHRAETGSPAGASRKGRGRRPRPRDAPGRAGTPVTEARRVGRDLSPRPQAWLQAVTWRSCPARRPRPPGPRCAGVAQCSWPGGESTPATRGPESWGARWAAGLGGAGAGAGAAWPWAGGRQEAGLIL